MEQAIAVVIAAAVAGVVSIATSLITARNQIVAAERRLEHEQRAEKEREREKQRIQYLDPLVVAATDLLAKIAKLREELREKEPFWKGVFKEVKFRDRSRREDFAFWCNGEGAGAVTTLYVTIVFFARAKKIRSELPFVQLGPEDDRALLGHLSEVREAFGGEHSLWDELQDSLGDYATRPDGTIMNYKEFCLQLMDTWGHIWLTRLIDFYKDVHMKQEHELPRIEGALKRLISFSRAVSSVKT